MTTIVYDGKTLAADTAEWIGDTYSGIALKVREVKCGHNEYLIAGSGIAVDLDLFCKQLKEGKDISEFDESNFICVNKNDPSDFCVYELGLKRKCQLPLIIGSGRDISYGALDAGCDALGAVKVACKRNAFTDYPIDTYTFDVDKFIYSRIEK